MIPPLRDRDHKQKMWKKIKKHLQKSKRKRNQKLKKSNELETIQSQWLDLLRKLRPINCSLEALLRSSEPVDYSAGVLTLKFFYKFHKERVEDPKNRMVVEKVFQDSLSIPVSLKM